MTLAHADAERPVTFDCAYAGALLATATVAKLAITGRPLGISGAVRGAVGGIFQGHVETWRIAFIVGIALGTLVAAGQLSLAFEAAPGEASQARFFISGACIGLGSALGANPSFPSPQLHA